MGKPDQKLDCIRISDLRARTILGINEWEREQKQDVSISIALHADLSAACTSDRVEDTINYKAIKTAVLNAVETSMFFLIEKMAEEIAQICLKDPRVERADVTVDKLGALRFASSVSVDISRTRRNG
jgi:FolB domain-containing protein